ncbi:MAG TPA: DNA-protecting protein DprA [Clostridiaceae bacterium]|nr:DNA-protecting protein DprA [Clostridiaceae bacterium]
MCGDIMENIIYYYWLSTVKGLNTRKAASIIEYFGSLKEAWLAGADDIMKIDGISDSMCQKIIQRRDADRLKKEIESIALKGIKILTIDDEAYPKRLKEIFDPPHVLYIKGNINNDLKCIGIVGTRKCTQYGRIVAREISKLICEYNIGVISGMARGIDTEAHIGALEEGGYTCAVLGCGLDIVYPPENSKLMCSIEKYGALISEYPPTIQPFARNFPARNRIISGMCDAVVIVEAGERSGALITADFALEQGRDVYAVPGSILSNVSKGTNHLIKEGAKPLTDISDILYELNIESKTADRGHYGENLDIREKMIVDALSDCPIHIDDLMRRLSLRVSEINSVITCLEMKGIIKILPGKYIVKIF